MHRTKDDPTGWAVCKSMREYVLVFHSRFRIIHEQTASDWPYISNTKYPCSLIIHTHYFHLSFIPSLCRITKTRKDQRSGLTSTGLTGRLTQASEKSIAMGEVPPNCLGTDLMLVIIDGRLLRIRILAADAKN